MRGRPIFMEKVQIQPELQFFSAGDAVVRVNCSLAGGESLLPDPLSDRLSVCMGHRVAISSPPVFFSDPTPTYGEIREVN